MRFATALPVLVLCLGSNLPTSFAAELKVYESYGDVVIKDGSKQLKLVVPAKMQAHSRYMIRIPKDESQSKRNFGTEDRVAARRIMYQANQSFFKGEIEKTWELIEKAEGLDPDYYRIKSMKGSLLYKIGSKDLAAELWQESLTKNPNQPEIRALLEKTLKEL